MGRAGRKGPLETGNLDSNGSYIPGGFDSARCRWQCLWNAVSGVQSGGCRRRRRQSCVEAAAGACRTRLAHLGRSLESPGEGGLKSGRDPIRFGATVCRTARLAGFQKVSESITEGTWTSRSCG